MKQKTWIQDFKVKWKSIEKGRYDITKSIGDEIHLLKFEIIGKIIE
jgi:hypothetical protein